MCGICGITGIGDKKLINRMCKILRHRGPDDWGVFVDSKISLGNVRLSIIDLSGGHQPIHNEDSSIWVSFNGEIYNFSELREELNKIGHKFYTKSDTETIVHLYETYGEEFLSRLHGMFALALWDSNKKLLILARDRLGKKPLYYAQINKNLIFASEIKAILEYPEFRPKLNLIALYHYLSFQYVPRDLTIFRNIKKLLPGQFLIWRNGKIKLKKYWNIKFSPKIQDLNFYTKKIVKLLEESVKRRLISEVPIGAYLSGGIDSSTVVVLMAKCMNESVKTISVGFGEKEDELEYARIIADYLNTDHKEMYVKSDTIKLLPDIIWHLDEPLADAAVIPVYLMSQVAKKYVKVVLTGDGGDETMGGYPHYKTLPFVYSHQKYYPLLIRRIIDKIVSPLPMYYKFIRYFKYIGAADKAEMYFRYSCVFSEEEKRKIFKQIKIKNLNSLNIIKPFFKSDDDFRNQLFLCDIKNLLAEDFNMKIDKMTMAHSIEARCPFLDQEWVKFTAEIPPDLKIYNGIEKYILKVAMKDILPKPIIKRKKHGFNVPINLWLTKELKEFAYINLLEKESITMAIFKEEFLKKIFKDIDKSYKDANKIWTLLILKLWYDKFILKN